MSLSEARKAVVAVVGASVVVLSTLGVALGPDVPTAVVGLFDAGVAVLTAIGVYFAENTEA
jgi:energy-converting hydrogenase Eha subunit E